MNCLICPTMRRALCIAPCTEEIAQALARVDVAVAEREILPPIARTPFIYMEAPQVRRRFYSSQRDAR